MKKPIDFESLFDILPERYVVFEPKSPEFTMIAANEQYLQVTAKTRDQLIGKGLFEVFPDTSEKALKTGKGDLQRSLEAVLKYKKADSTGIIRYDLADNTGKMQVRYWQATHYPVMEGTKCVAIVQSTADVTEIFNSSEELKLANVKLEQALSAGLIGSWSWDVKNDLVSADRGLSTIFGVSADEALMGLPLQTFLNSIYKDDRKKVSALIKKAIADQDAFECEYRTIDTNGVVRWVIARGKIERNDKGQAVTFPGVMIDISSRKESEYLLQESEQRLRFMADTMPQLVWIARPDGYHEYYNKHWYEFTGTKEGETDGKGWNNLFHSSDRVKAQKVWKESLETGKPYEIEYRLYHAKSGEYRWVIGRALPFRNEDGEIVKWYGTCTDIDDSVKEIEKRKALEKELKEERDRLDSRVKERTQQLKLTNEGLRDEIKKRRTAEKKLREYSLELQRSNKELEEFAYVSSHDLQEPLRKIQSFSDLLVEEYGDKLGDGYEYLSRIQSSAKRMSSLIEDLLAFSRVSTKPAVTKQVNLNDVIQDVIIDLSERIDRERGTVMLNATLPTVKADEIHMRQLFQNLISNAMKFHSPDRDPIVEVAYWRIEDEHFISVKDNGIGIDEKYKDKIFAVFQRLNARKDYEGTGIGLAVCKKIVERYGGTIKIESQLGTGTTFIITLPVENEV